MASNHGKFVWYELMTSDSNAAESFYRSVVGWNMQDSGMPGMAYTLLSAGETMVGGLMTIPEEARAMGTRPCWLGYVGVDDVDGYAQRVKAAGGVVHRQPADIPGIGRFSVVADPHGAIFVLFKGSTDQTPVDAPPGTLGHIGWHELYAGSLESDFAFYSGLFGWTKAEAVDMGPMGIYQTFAMGGPPSGGMMTKPPEVPMPAWAFYFNVDAADAVAARITSAGGKVLNGPHQVPGGSWIVQGLDPQGAMFACVAPKR